VLSKLIKTDKTIKINNNNNNNNNNNANEYRKDHIFELPRKI